MDTKNRADSVHPKGEDGGSDLALVKRRSWVETYGGKVYVEWDPEAAVTPLGQLPFFIAFLKAGGLFDPWVEDCPLPYTSPNAPPKRDVLGTLLLSVLSGHRRYAHITGLRWDGVSPELLGMEKVRSEDSVRRSFQRSDAEACASWQARHLEFCYGPLLHEPWILDVDTTVKTLYGHQEGAEVGFNPAKPGRPSHTYHTYFVANLRLVLDVDVQAGNRTAAMYSRPGLWLLLDRLGRARWPRFVRGDCAWGNEGPMRECEDRGLDYLFKVRQTANVRRLIVRLFSRREWADAGQGWEGIEDRLQLTGWSRSRRVIVLRRRLRGNVALVGMGESGQLEMAFIESDDPLEQYEYAVLVTTLSDSILTLAQHYRDRADAENNFDELKNHWGWCGFTTHDLKRCRLASRMVALVYNWWSIFVRLASGKHREAITSRPLLLNGVARQTKHSGQTTITITTHHAKSSSVRAALQALNAFFRHIRHNAEQLHLQERMKLIIRKAYAHIFNFLQHFKLLPNPA